MDHFLIVINTDNPEDADAWVDGHVDDTIVTMARTADAHDFRLHASLTRLTEEQMGLVNALPLAYSTRHWRSRLDHEAPDDVDLPFVVGLNGETPVNLKRFATHDEAAAFVGELEGVQDGRYFLDGPET